MTVTHSRRRARTFGLVMSAALPLCFASCSPMNASSQQAMELRAGANSDLLEVSTERVYEVVDTQLISPFSESDGGNADGDTDAVAGVSGNSSDAYLDGALTTLFEQTVSSSGRIVLIDGVITEGRIVVRTLGTHEAVFEITEPTALRYQAGGSADADVEESTVSVIGTLTTESFVRPQTRIRVTPTELTEHEAEFQVRITVPDNPLIESDGFPYDEISARMVFSAE